MNELFLTFPNVLKIEPQNLQLRKTISSVKLSVTSDVQISMSQSIENFNVSKRYQFLNGVTKDIKVISIAGIVSDDIAWGRAVQYAMDIVKPDFSFRNLRAKIASKLEMLFDLEELVTIYDTTIGKRTNCIITSLNMKPSQDFENASEWQIGLAQVRLLDSSQIADVTTGQTIDPYTYYDFGEPIL